MADKKEKDPTVRTGTAATYPEGTHPVRSVEEADDAGVNKKYEDNPDKPNKSTIAQVEVVD